MKKLLLITLTFMTYIAFGQCVDPLITDFECSPASQALPGTVASVTNSYSGGINTSANIGEYTDDGTSGWDALIIDYGAAIDLSTNNILSFKLYSPTSIQVLAKIEGGTAVEIWSDFSAVNTWQEFSYDFSAAAANGNTTLVLFFNAGKEDGTATDLYYFDDLQWSATLSVDDVDLSDAINVFPNPANDKINVNSKVDVDAFELVDVTGKTILEESKTFEASFTIDISTLKSGLYFLNVKSNKANKVIKILKE
ncbi:T9SS type A sorting domain-containing protein [Algibacter agarivorans]